MNRVSPSILSADFVNLERDIRALTPAGADYVHVDVMDGLFVPNISIGLPVVSAIRKVTELPLDVHLMIDRPIRYAEGFLKSGADWLTIHLEADTPENTMACLEKIRALGGKAGLALKPGTPAEAALPYLTQCDMILVMTVEPGFGGQGLIEETLPKIAALRAEADRRGLALDIEVDGGIKAENIGHVASFGANIFVAGSSVFGKPDRAAAIATLRAAAEQ